MMASSYLLDDILGGRTLRGRELFDLCSVDPSAAVSQLGSVSWWSGSGELPRGSGGFPGPSGGMKDDGVVLCAVARDMPGPGMDSPVSLFSLFVRGVLMPLVDRLPVRLCLRN